MSFTSTLRSALTPIHLAPAAPGAGEGAGRRAALLERLYREHADRIYGLCLRMSGDRERAAELTQDVFVRAWEQLHRLAPDSDAGAWLWRLATNLVLNTKRAERRRLARVAPVADPALLEQPSLRTPLAVRRMSLEAAVAHLPDRARAVYLLHDVEGFSQGEIATMLGIAAGTVRAHLHKARTTMRELLR